MLQINPILYSLQKQNIVVRCIESPPSWALPSRVRAAPPPPPPPPALPAPPLLLPSPVEGDTAAAADTGDTHSALDEATVSAEQVECRSYCFSL